MTAVRKWLEAISLGQYADAFEANDIDIDLLSEIDDQVLKDIAVSSRHCSSTCTSAWAAV
jgi:hypothetical protein